MLIILFTLILHNILVLATNPISRSSAVHCSPRDSSYSARYHSRPPREDCDKAIDLIPSGRNFRVPAIIHYDTCTIFVEAIDDPDGHSPPRLPAHEAVPEVKANAKRVLKELLARDAFICSTDVLIWCPPGLYFPCEIKIEHEWGTSSEPPKKSSRWQNVPVSRGKDLSKVPETSVSKLTESKT